MKRHFLPLLIAVVSVSHATAAPANPSVRADLPGYTGFDDCRIAPLEPAPRNEVVEWNGACEGGFAVGKGELDWKDEKKNRYRLKAKLVRGEVQGEGELKTAGYTYIGTFLRGMPHGTGFFTYKSGNMYEGGVAHGEQDGKGIFVWMSRSEYVGEWKDGKRQGWGEMKYAEGGSYSGQWHLNKWHGKGELVHAGSGRKFEGRFEDGRIAGSAQPAIDDEKYALLHKDRTPSLTSSVPLDASWEQLTETQKNGVRETYAALEQGDDPPYPVKGRRQVFEAVVKLNRMTGAAEGNLTIYVLVGADGKAKHATIFEKPVLRDAEDVEKLVKNVAGVMMLDTYKPAMCQGKPCEMVYPINYVFDIAGGPGVPPMFR